MSTPAVTSQPPPPILPAAPVEIVAPLAHASAGAAASIGPAPQVPWLMRAPLFSQAALLWWACALLIAMGWDRAAWLAVSSGGATRFAWLEAAASPSGLWATLTSVHSLQTASEAALALLYAVAYFVGRMWLWLALGAALVFRGFVSPDASRVRSALRQGVFIALVPAVAGLGAEVLKLITRRQRPEALDGFYAFRAPAGSPIDPEFWSTSGLGLASSHAAVAIAAAAAGAVLFPRFRWPLALLALACCFSRLVVGAHFLSDVLVGAFLGVLAARLIYAWDRRNNQGAALMPAGAGTPRS